MELVSSLPPCVIPPSFLNTSSLPPSLPPALPPSLPPSLLPGTDATHAEHIETIKNRKYVGLQGDGYFVPGELGMGLVEGTDKHSQGSNQDLYNGQWGSKVSTK